MIPKSFKHLQLLSFHLRPIISHSSQSDAAILMLSSFPFSYLSEPKEPTNPKHKLTQEELNKINLLIPRLCLSDNLPTAVHLTSTALLTDLPPKSLSYSILIHSLTSQPDLIQPMSLLTRLRHTPTAHTHLPTITTMLVISYLRKGRLREALKVYNWVLRPGSPCKLEPVAYGVLLVGFCRNGLAFEALRVLRNMLEVNLLPGDGLRKRIFRTLLREARVNEAKELNEALGYIGVGGVDGEDVKKVLDLLDQMIGNWTD